MQNATGHSNHNNHRKQRFSQGGGSGGGHSNHNGGGHNRPRKNYGALREKYLAQARDTLAQGDRVLAENYLQHADHCYRMMMEENASRPQQQPRPQQQQAQAGENIVVAQEEEIPQAGSQLPAFLTGNYEPEQPKPEPATAQGWEERDEA